jgi:3-hydroxybutyryl-CoA dehydrogenase
MIIGSGIMGSGIAQVISQAGHPVHIVDSNQKALQRSKENITKGLDKLVKKNKINKENRDNILTNQITWSDNLEKTLEDKCFDVIIEAIPEMFALKKSIIQIINTKHQNNEDVIYASNTSSISITKMAHELINPKNFIGMHFMNPVPIMKLVEIIPGIQTDTTTVKKIEKFSAEINKTTVLSKDYAGFIANRILIPMINEAFYALMEGLGTANDIDTAMQLGCNHPMGPLTLADFIGLDTCLYVPNILHQEIGDSKYRACPLLKQYVAAGWLGKKTNRGVYIYKK